MGALRFFLSLCVVVAHVASFSFPWGVSAHDAVMVFFIISGFYMTMILNKTYIGQGSVVIFFFSRFFRLWPIYLIVTICTMLAPLFFANYGDNPNNWIWPAIISGNMPLGAAIGILFSNFFMIFHDWQFYFSRDVSHGFTLIQGFSGGLDLWAYDYVPQAWSIGTEISFYLVAPFIVRNMRTILIAMTASLLINLYWIHVGARFEPWRYMFLPSVLYLFLLGAAGYHVFLNGWLKNINFVDVLLALMSVVTIVLVSSKVNGDRPLYIASAPLQFAKYALIIPILFMLTKNYKIDRFIGELSYPLYLCHLLILHIVNAVSTKGTGALVIALSVSVAIILVVAVDYPVDAWRHRVSQRFMRRRKNSMNVIDSPMPIALT